MNLRRVLIRGIGVVFILSLLLPLEGCVPAASVQWTIVSDKKNATPVNEDVEALGKILDALGYVKQDIGNLPKVNYFSSSQSDRLTVTLLWSQDSPIKIRLMESGVKELSSLGNQQIILINEELNKKFGIERVTFTKF